MAKTAGAGKRHAMALFNLIERTVDLTEAVIRDFIEERREKKYLQQSLGRMVEKGLVVRESGKLELSEKGILWGIKNNPKFKKKLLRKNGSWYVLSFDIPVELNAKRNDLTRLLKQCDFYRLQKSVWILPDRLSSILWEFLVRQRLDKFCRIMQVRIIDGEKDILNHFRRQLPTEP